MPQLIIAALVTYLAPIAGSLVVAALVTVEIGRAHV